MSTRLRTMNPLPCSAFASTQEVLGQTGRVGRSLSLHSPARCGGRSSSLGRLSATSISAFRLAQRGAQLMAGVADESSFANKCSVETLEHLVQSLAQPSDLVDASGEPQVVAAVRSMRSRSASRRIRSTGRRAAPAITHPTAPESSTARQSTDQRGQRGRAQRRARLPEKPRRRRCGPRSPEPQAGGRHQVGIRSEHQPHNGGFAQDAPRSRSNNGVLLTPRRGVQNLRHQPDRQLRERLIRLDHCCPAQLSVPPALSEPTICSAREESPASTGLGELGA